MSYRVWRVRDPQGLTHMIALVDDERWFGYENLAHGFELHERGAVTREVTRAAATGAKPPHGFTVEEVS